MRIMEYEESWKTLEVTGKTMLQPVHAIHPTTSFHYITQREMKSPEDERCHNLSNQTTQTIPLQNYL